MEKLIPLVEVPDDREFWVGTRFRRFKVGMNVQDKTQDYYDYMLANVPGESDYMLVVNVTQDAGRYKAGGSMCMVKTLDGVNRFVVTGKALKASVGTDNIFLLFAHEN